MKAIMISIKPKWVAKILNGEKTIEIRKTCPAIFKHLKSYEGAELDVYIYCTKDKQDFLVNADLIRPPFPHPRTYMLGHKDYSLNGKVVAKFTLNKVEEIKLNLGARLFTKTFTEEELLKNACLTTNEIEDYLFSNVMQGYAWHIDNLEIFDKPKKLSEFKKNNAIFNCWKCTLFGSGCKTCQLTKAPQSWCYMEVGQ